MIKMLVNKEYVIYCFIGVIRFISMIVFGKSFSLKCIHTCVGRHICTRISYREDVKITLNKISFEFQIMTELLWLNHLGATVDPSESFILQNSRIPIQPHAGILKSMDRIVT